MKLLIICFAALFLMVNVTYAQTIKQISDAKKQEEVVKSSSIIIPPITIRAAFAKEHSGLKVTWKKERGYYEANYSDNGKVMSTLYSDGGHKIESETIIPQDQMPPSIMEYIRGHFKGEKIKETSIIKKSNGEENYEVEIKGMDVLFSKDGKYIRSIKD